jgi:sugar phosphate isomerase/epimerase
MDLSLLYDHILEASTQSGLSVTEVLGRARASGILGVDCSLEHARGCEEEFSAMLTDAGLLAASIRGPLDLDLVDVALKMGAGKVLAIPSVDGEPAGSGEDGIAGSLAALAARAAEAGIVVAVDSGLTAFLEAQPDLRCSFDTGSPMLGGFDAIEALERLKGRIVHVRCRDFALSGGRGTSVGRDPAGIELYPSPLGSGRVKLGRIIQELESSGYRGWYAIEHSGSPDQLGFMEQSARWLLSPAAKE